MAVFLRGSFITSHSHHSHAAAQSGGALSGLNGTYVRVQESRFESNHAKVRCGSSSVPFVRQSDHDRCFAFYAGGWGRSAAIQGRHVRHTAFDDVPSKLCNKQH